MLKLIEISNERNTSITTYESESEIDTKSESENSLGMNIFIIICIPKKIY